jgi:acid phosphatase type 7
MLALAMACSEAPRPPTGPSPPGATPPPGSPPPNQTAVLVAVGDIGMCGPNGPLSAVAQTANTVEGIDGQVVLAGDLAYMQGTPQDFARCFDPHWGQFRHRWRPVPGNHEYETRDAAGYFQYFGEAAGGGGRPYYSFRAGNWLVLMLNSNVDARAGSAQFEYVRAELQTGPTRCAMAVWHHPLFSSGPNGPNRFMRDMWRLLYDGGADVIVAGHDHFYERYGKQDTDARSDSAGLRQFIVGTGGAHLSPFLRTEPNSQARISEHGVLRLTLHSLSYDWAFVQTNGAIADIGGDSCH